MQCSYNRRDMRIEQGGYRVYCVRVWPYPRCGSDRLPYILERWSQLLRIIGNSWKKTAETIATMPVKYIDREKTLFPSGHLEG